MRSTHCRSRPDRSEVRCRNPLQGLRPAFRQAHGRRDRLVPIGNTTLLRRPSHGRGRDCHRGRRPLGDQASRPPGPAFGRDDRSSTRGREQRRRAPSAACGRPASEARWRKAIWPSRSTTTSAPSCSVSSPFVTLDRSPARSRAGPPSRRGGVAPRAASGGGPRGPGTACARVGDHECVAQTSSSRHPAARSALCGVTTTSRAPAASISGAASTTRRRSERQTFQPGCRRGTRRPGVRGGRARLRGARPRSPGGMRGNGVMARILRYLDSNMDDRVIGHRSFPVARPRAPALDIQLIRRRALRRNIDN